MTATKSASTIPLTGITGWSMKKNNFIPTNLPNDFFKNLFDMEINFDKNPDIQLLKNLLLLYKVYILILLAWN